MKDLLMLKSDLIRTIERLNPLLFPRGRVYKGSMKSHKQETLYGYPFRTRNQFVIRMDGITLTMISVFFAVFLGSCFGGPMYEAGFASDPAKLGAPLEAPPQDMKSGMWRMEDDIEIFHFIGKNRGKRNVLYIHGGPGFPPDGPLAGLDDLGKSFTTHYYHQRGCGKSTRPIDRFQDGNYYGNMQTLVRRLGFRAQLADIERIRRILGDEKLILVGHSFGGFFATLYAAEFPHRVEKLILVAPAGVVRMPPVSGGLFGSIEAGLSEKRKSEFKRVVEQMFDFSTVFDKTDADHREIQNAWVPFYSEAFQNLKERKKGIALSHPEWTGGFSIMAAYFDLGYRSDFRPFLKKVEAPTLILYGSEDLSGMETFADYDAIPDSRMVELPGQDHFLLNSDSSGAAEVIRSFLK